MPSAHQLADRYVEMINAHDPDAVTGSSPRTT